MRQLRQLRAGRGRVGGASGEGWGGAALAVAGRRAKLAVVAGRTAALAVVAGRAAALAVAGSVALEAGTTTNIGDGQQTQLESAPAEVGWRSSLLVLESGSLPVVLVVHVGTGDAHVQVERQR